METPGKNPPGSAPFASAGRTGTDHHCQGGRAVLLLWVMASCR